MKESLKWVYELTNKYLSKMANVFILEGNVSDKIDGKNFPPQILERINGVYKDAGDEKIVVHYERSRGLFFKDDLHKLRFGQLIGVETGWQQPVSDNIEEGVQEKIEVDRQVLEEIDEELIAQAGKDPNGVFAFLDPLFQLNLPELDQNGDVIPRIGLIIHRAELIFPDADLSSLSAEDRTLVDYILQWAKELPNEPPITLVSRDANNLNKLLRQSGSRVETVSVPLPRYEQRLEFINRAMEELEEAEIVFELTSEEIANKTAGLSLLGIEDIFYQCFVSSQAVDSDSIRERKKAITNQEFGEQVTFSDPDLDLSSWGGPERLKNVVRNIKHNIEEDKLWAVPKGILLAGPPGTGKTMLSSCLAKELGIQVVEWSMAKIQNKYVGESEKNMERVWSAIQAVAPAVVVIDEVDQLGLSRNSSGDSGVSNRLFSRLMEFMNDETNRGRIIFVLITNRPDLLDPAMIREGRIDYRIPILEPEPEERLEIFKIITSKYGLPCNISEDDLKEVAYRRELKGFTGAQIQALVREAGEVAMIDGNELCKEHLEEAIENYIPVDTNTQEMAEASIRLTNNMRFLPPRLQEVVKNNRQKEQQPQPQPEKNTRKARAGG